MKKSQRNFRSLAWIAWIGTLSMLPVEIYCISISPSRAAEQQITQLSEEQLKQVALSITVKVISGEDSGSGILMKKDGQVYTVLTNQHVLEVGKAIQIQTPDGKISPANLVTGINFQGKDLALVQFRANANYVVASLGNISTGAINEPVFAAGFPSEANLSPSQRFAFTKGQALYVPKKAFKEGYQIGYNNKIEKGMSGGPILNRYGKVIGLNGIHAYPLWGNPYVYEDDSQPTDAERDSASRYSWGIPIQTFARLAPQYASKDALPLTNNPSIPSTTTLPPIANDVNNTAQKITVLIKWSQGNGSGVIVGRQGNTYYVLTADHVVRNKTDFEVVTHDGNQHLVKVDQDTVKTLEGVDLAVFKFTSNNDYEVATLAGHNLENKGGLVFVSGWSGAKKKGDRATSPLFTAGNLFKKDSSVFLARQSVSLNLGYGLVYTNLTQPGVSGGPVLDVRGHVIGIHGRADRDYAADEAAPGYGVQLGYSLGIPISTFLSQVNKVGLNLEQLKIYTAKPPSLTNKEQNSILEALVKLEKPSDTANARAWLDYGNQKWRQFEYEESLTAFNKAIKLNPSLYQAWYASGLTLLEQQKYPEALAAFDRAVRESKEKFAPAWRGRGQVLAILSRYKEALESFDKAIALDDKYFVVPVWQGDMLQALGHRQQALEAYSAAIKIKPHPLAYNQRGLVYSSLGNRPAAFADYSEAIKISPDYADAYINRGWLQYTWGNTKAALIDIDKAVEVAPNYASGYFSRGILRYQLKDKQKAIADFGKAIQIEPQNPYFYLKLASIYYNEEDNQEAIAYCNKAIEVYAYFPEAFYSRGLVYHKIGNQKAALADLQKAADLYKQQGNQNFYQQMLAIMEQFQKTASASTQSNKFTVYEGPALNTTYQLPGKASIKIFETDKSSGMVKVQIFMSQGLYGEGELEGKINQNNVLELSGKLGLPGGEFFDSKVRLEFLPNSTIKGVYTIFAGSNNSRGRDQSGELTLTKVNEINSDNVQGKLNPQDPEAYNKRGEFRYSQGDYTGAVTNYNEAIRLKPNYTEAHYNRGFALVKQGELQKAIEDFNIALRLKPDLLDIYYIRGLSHADLKQYKEAIQDYDQILRPQEFSGIGVQTEINSQTKILTVAKVIENSPAHKNGIKAGDQILVINGQSTANMSLEQAIKLIRGQTGTPVTLQINRAGKNNLNITLTRTPIAVDTKFADVYYYRGLARIQVKDNQGARQDLQKAADLYKQQGKADEYQKVIAEIKKLPQ